MIMFVSRPAIGGRIANPALAKAPSTQTTDVMNKLDASMSDKRTESQISPMYEEAASSHTGNVASAAAITVATAKKKDKLLKDVKHWMVT
jgi:hypothetical protein